MDFHGDILLLPPNRVWRTYPGGMTLDGLAGVEVPGDTHLAEDWIGSVTEARNPGREGRREGLSRVAVRGRERVLQELLEDDPEYFLGAAHVARFGAHPMLLVKFLDSAVRLHFQAHPTREFAQARLGARSGKTEAYYVLGTRQEGEGFIYLGFQRAPGRTELKRMIEIQDVAAIERCFDRIPVRAGDAYVVPGGFPHALGAGVFLVEIQEPSDLVVRFEFEKAGYVLPESARFMGRGIDVALDLMDLKAHPLAEIERRCRCRPRRVEELGPGCWVDELIGPGQTDCFRVRRATVSGKVKRRLNAFAIVIVVSGEAIVGGHRLGTYDKFAVPAGLETIEVESLSGCQLLECLPPAV